jgi:hypothetical protein
MTTRPLTPLGDLITGYPAEAPQSFVGVWQADLDQLPTAAREVRRHLVDFRNAIEQAPVLSAADLADLLESGRLRPLRNCWLVIPLGADRRRVLSPVLTEEGVMAVVDAAKEDHPEVARNVRRALAEATSFRWAWQSHVSRRVPLAADLDEALPLPRGGRYVLVFGGSPELLEHDGIRQALERLLERAPVADVCFWTLAQGAAPTCFSLGEGRGQQGGRPVEFPNTQTAAELRAALQGGASS